MHAVRVLLPSGRAGKQQASLVMAQATLGAPRPWCRRLCSLQAHEWVRARPCPHPLLAPHAVPVRHMLCSCIALRAAAAACATSVRWVCDNFGCCRPRGAGRGARPPRV